jgi:hypothetical protein
MNYLLPLLFLFGADGGPSHRPKVPQCFQVNRLLKMDSDHYWADWTNACPYTIDSVYVMVRFADKSGKHQGNGVWALHFVLAGAHRTIRFTTPSSVTDFESVDVGKITTDSAEALR